MLGIDVISESKYLESNVKSKKNIDGYHDGVLSYLNNLRNILHEFQE